AAPRLPAYHAPAAASAAPLSMKQAFHILVLLAWGLAGCRGNVPDRPAQPSLARSLGLAEPALVEPVHAIASPPRGWAAEPLKQSDRHAHQVWMSPTGRTAYGVIHFALPGIADIFGIPY